MRTPWSSINVCIPRSSRLNRTTPPLVASSPRRERTVMAATTLIGVEVFSVNGKRTRQSALMIYDAEANAASMVAAFEDQVAWFAGEALPDPPVLLFVETAGLDATGALSIFGWAVARLPVTAVQIDLGDGELDLASIGLLREDVGRIHAEVKRRPLYVVGARVGFEERQAARGEQRGAAGGEQREAVR